MRKSTIINLLLALSIFVVPQGAVASRSESLLSRNCLDGVCFAPSIEVGGEKLSLLGIGKAQFLFFDVYIAALYGRAGAPGRADILGPVAKVLEIHYLRDLEPEQFIKYSIRTIRRNPEVNLAAISSPLEAMNELYQPVAPGDRYRLEYNPELGVNLILNGESLGQVEGADFARAYFGIWLSDYSISKNLTRELLKGLSKNSQLAGEGNG